MYLDMNLYFAALEKKNNSFHAFMGKTDCVVYLIYLDEINVTK